MNSPIEFILPDKGIIQWNGLYLCFVDFKLLTRWKPASEFWISFHGFDILYFCIITSFFQIQVAIKCLNKDKIDQCSSGEDGQTESGASRYHDFLREVNIRSRFRYYFNLWTFAFIVHIILTCEHWFSLFILSQSLNVRFRYPYYLKLWTFAFVFHTTSNWANVSCGLLLPTTLI